LCLYPCKILRFKTSFKCPRSNAGMLFDSITDKKSRLQLNSSFKNIAELGIGGKGNHLWWRCLQFEFLHLVRRRPASSHCVTQKLSWWRYKFAVSIRWNFDPENGILRARRFCWRTSSFEPGVVKCIKYTVCTGRVLLWPLPGNTGSSEACQHFEFGLAPQIGGFRRLRALWTDWKTVFTRHNWT